MQNERKKLAPANAKRAHDHRNGRAPFFLAYLGAGFLFLGLDAIELRIGSAK